MKRANQMNANKEWIEEPCPCGRVWRGKSGCSLNCDECYPVDEDALEEFECKRRQKIAESNEY